MFELFDKEEPEEDRLFTLFPLEELIWYEVNYLYSLTVLSRIHYNVDVDNLHEREMFVKNWNGKPVWKIAG